MSLVITRTFNAPVQKVWDAWTKPEECMKWWGPKDFTAPFCQNDLRIGGKYLNCMQGPDGTKFWSTGTYKEIELLKKLVLSDSFSDEQGNVISGAVYGMPDLPMEMEVTIAFEELDGLTKITLTHAGLPEGDMQEQTNAGWNESLDKLVESLK